MPPYRTAATLLLIGAGTLSAQASDRKTIATMRAWLDSYRKGKLAVGDDYRNIAGKSLVKKSGIITKDMFQRDNGVLRRGQFSHREEIEVLLNAAGASQSPEVAAALLEFCAIGLDDSVRYTPAMVPYHVRALAESNLAKNSVATAKWLENILSGTEKLRVRKPFEPAIRAAALRALTVQGGPPGAALAALASPNPVVRLAAVETLGQSRNKTSLPPLVETLEKEQNQLVRQHLHLWIGRLISSVQHKVDAGVGKRAAALLGRDLSSTIPWHTRAQLAEIVPVHGVAQHLDHLITILEQFETTPKAITAGHISGILRHRAHEVLRKQTGAFYRIDSTAAWRAFRKHQESGSAKPNAHKPTKPDKGTFFGIPVRGSQVLFVIDRGDAMRLPLPRSNPDLRNRWKPKTTRIECTRTETARALRGLKSWARFEILCYSDRVKAANKGLAPATKTTVTKAIKTIARWSPAKNYNLGAALVQALGIERLHYAQPGGVADEIFIVSSHMNQFGPIKAPDDLVGLVAEIRRFSQVRIHTVYLGTADDPDDPDERGPETMRRIAELTGGAFVRL